MERSLIVSRCQKRIGKMSVIRQIKTRSLGVIKRDGNILFERVERKVKEVEVRLSSGMASPPIVSISLFYLLQESVYGEL